MGNATRGIYQQTLASYDEVPEWLVRGVQESWLVANPLDFGSRTRRSLAARSALPAYLDWRDIFLEEDRRRRGDPFVDADTTRRPGRNHRGLRARTRPPRNVGFHAPRYANRLAHPLLARVASTRHRPTAGV